jgi:hypothetical protein
MIVVGRQLQTQLETRRFEEPHQRRQRRLAAVMLVGRHHGPGHASPLGQLGLAQPGLQPGVSQQPGARGWHFVVDTHVHDCIPPLVTAPVVNVRRQPGPPHIADDAHLNDRFEIDWRQDATARDAAPRAGLPEVEDKLMGRVGHNEDFVTETRDAGPTPKGRAGVSAGQPRWRWDLNPRWTFTHTRFRVLRTHVQPRSSASATCSTRPSTGVTEPPRTTTNETRTETTSSVASHGRLGLNVRLWLMSARHSAQKDAVGSLRPEPLGGDPPANQTTCRAPEMGRIRR